MAYASRSGRARTSPSSPEAFGVCDRCSIWYQRNVLKNQFQWRGASLMPLNLYVCPECYDTPQEQLRAIVVPADPTPIVNPRVEPYLYDETDYQTITAPTVYDPITGIPIPSTTTLIAQDGADLTTQVIGPPVGLVQPAVMPLNQGVEYGVELNVLSVTANGTDQILVTCNTPHGLTTLDQISIEELSNGQACGFFSVTVTSATALTYQTANLIPSGALVTNTTNILTCIVGLPLGYDTIPQVT